MHPAVTKIKEDMVGESRLDKTFSERFGSMEYLVACDFDNTLTGDHWALHELKKKLATHKQRVGFAVATGRSTPSAKEALSSTSLDVDVLISSVGTEIYYSNTLLADTRWAAHIAKDWSSAKVLNRLKKFEELEPQEYWNVRSPLKVSYMVWDVTNIDSLLARITKALTDEGIAFNLIFSHEHYLDVIPQRSSKGAALAYIAKRWNLDPSSIVTAGDSGNDADMLVHPFKSIVVANHEHVLKTIPQHPSLYYAQNHFAAGVLEGLKEFKVFAS
ncbi:MAG: HAD-IIB family hydrolase [Sphaerochaetaceae bacterium]|jgi:sucrose-phosphate synthase